MNVLNDEEIKKVIAHTKEYYDLDEMARQKRALDSLNRTSTALLDGYGEQEILNQVIEGVRAIGFDRVRIYLLSADGQYLAGRAGFDVSDGFVGASWPVLHDQHMQRLIEEPIAHLFDYKKGIPGHPEKDLHKEGVAGWAAAPMMYYGEVIGQVAADNKHSRYPITPHQLDWLVLFAGRAAAAIHRARRFEALLKVSTTISSSLDLDKILGVACQAAVEFLRVDHSAMVLFDALEKEATVIAEYPRMEASGLTIPLRGVKMEEQLINERTPVVVEDVNDDACAEFLGSVREIFLDLKLRSVLIVPIISQEKVIGSFSLDSISGLRKFNDEEINLCKVFASQLAVAIENSRSYEVAVRSKGHLERLIACSYSGIIAINNDGIVTTFNEQAEKIQGYLADEVVGKVEVSNLYADPATPRQIGRLLHTNSQGRLADYPTAVKTKDGRTIPVRISATWLYDGDGKREGSVGFFQDLTSIRETKKRLDLLLQAGNVIATAANTEEGLQRLAEMMVVLLGSTFCRILLFDESLQFMVAKAAFLKNDPLNGLAWEPGLGQRIDLTEWDRRTLDEGKPVVIGSQDTNLRSRLSAFSQRLKLGHDIQWLLLMPLKISDKPFGLLSVAEISGADNPFTAEKIELASILADKSAILIYRQRQHEIIERRGKLLDKLDEALRNIRAEKEESKLQQEITRLASELFDCTASALYIHRPSLKKLDWRFSHPRQMKPGLLSQAEVLTERVVQTGEMELLDCGPQALVGIPLKRGGNVEAVLILADETGRLPHLKSDMEILERFAAHAAIALSNSRLLSQELRQTSRSVILDKINYYISRVPLGEDLDKILHLILTGVTAGYGLGFNRAALILREGRDGDLTVRMAIGQLTPEQVRHAWDFDRTQRLSDFGVYLRHLDKEALPRTPLWERLEDWWMPRESGARDIFSLALARRQFCLLARHELGLLPESFRQRFEPETEVAVVPLIVRGQVIGLLVADNKFTLSPITGQDMDSLAIFANTAGLAVDNERVVQQSREARASLLALFKASNSLVVAEDSRRVLQDIAQETCRVAEADWVCIIQVDQKGYAEDLAEIGLGKSISLDEAVREGGTTHHVLDTGEPEVIEDCAKVYGEINPIFRDEAVTLICLPLSTPGKRIGVVWIGYATPRPLPDFRIEGLQLYVNQAAVAYDNARRLKDAERMRKAAEEMAGARSPQEVTEQIVRHARGVMKADSTSFWVYDAGQGVFIEGGSEKDGISDRDWREFWKIEPQLDGIADTIRNREYGSTEDVSKCEKYPALTDSAKKLLKRMGVQSFQGVALKVGDECLGVLFINYKRPRVFSQEEQETAIAFANHAALALKKARLHDQIARAHNNARVVAEVTTLGDWRGSLKSIVQGTREALGCDAVTLYVYDNDKQEFNYPPAMIGVKLEEEVKKLGRVTEKSVVRRVLEEKEMHVAPDATKEGELLNGPFVEREGVKSVAALPLIVDDRKVGVMFVNYHAPHQFSEDELTDIKLFAHQAAVAVRNGQMYEELKQNKKTIAARTALAFMGIASSTWLHQTKGHAINIKDLLTLIRRRLPNPVLEEAASELDTIKEMADLIITEAVTAPLQSEEAMKSLPINNFLNERFKQLRELGSRHKQIRARFDFELDGKATVRINPDWLSRVIDVLVDNADQAMKHLTERGLTVRTRLAEAGYAEIQLCDCGSGMSSEVWERLLEDPIEHPKGDKRTGMGLLMARFILQTYGGDILKGSTSSTGTTMVIRLPLEKQNGTEGGGHGTQD